MRSFSWLVSSLPLRIWSGDQELQLWLWKRSIDNSGKLINSQYFQVYVFGALTILSGHITTKTSSQVKGWDADVGWIEESKTPKKDRKSSQAWRNGRRQRQVREFCSSNFIRGSSNWTLWCFNTPWHLLIMHCFFSSTPRATLNSQGATLPSVQKSKCQSHGPMTIAIKSFSYQFLYYGPHYFMSLVHRSKNSGQLRPRRRPMVT